jgi:hypothetical protein
MSRWRSAYRADDREHGRVRGLPESGECRREQRM